MPLRGIRIIELAGLAPAPFCGMILADFGASVTLVDRTASNSLNILTAGKRRIALDLKTASGKAVFARLCAASDVLVEPYRPGVMEKLGLGPQVLCAQNPRLIYARLTGFGQTGPLAARAGHDINYVAMSGVLSLLGRSGHIPQPPVNLLADMAGGGLLCALGICVALLERHGSGRGQVVDAAMSEGAAYVASWLSRSQTLMPIWGAARGENVLDGGSFYYDCYETSEPGRYMSVGALEPHFYQQFVETLGLPELQQHGDETQCRRLVAERFRSKTQAEWTRLFEPVDACVFPVLDWKRDAPEHEHNRERRVFLEATVIGGDPVVATPAPRLSRTPAVSGVERTANGGAGSNEQQDWRDVLAEIGMGAEEMQQLHRDGALLLPMESKL